MKLKRLEISGFKSFVDPVVLDFAPGVTGIVGPNGCGKSNLSDAISWVLGEQSAKSLRSGTMEDVIFNGSEKRKPLGMAEVSLTLEADPSVPGAVDGAIVINRRVYRGGEGQYRLNGRRVRLKEIRDLLMGTGLGIRAYSIIEQGKIGLILSGKPQERRRLLEEAAGVTRYKQRRRIAELKLEEATANLLRLEDIIGEVERALRSLKRQASAARRYESRKQEYSQLLDQVLQARWHALSERQSTCRESLAERTDSDAALVAEMHRLEAQLAERREELDRLASRVAELHQRDAELAARIEGRQALRQGTRDTLDQIGERIAAGDAGAAERQRRAGENRAAIERLDEQRTELEAERLEAQQAVLGDRDAISERSHGLGETERQLATLREDLLQSVGRLNAARSDHHRQVVELEKASLRAQHLADEQEAHAEELAEAQAALESARLAVGGLEAEVEALREGRERLEAQLQGELDVETRVAQELQAARDGHDQSRRRIELLEQLEAAHRRGREGLVQRLEALGYDETRFLGDVTSAPDGWGPAIDFYLAQLSEAVLVPTGTDPLEVADALRESRTPAVLLAGLAEPIERSELDDPAVVGRISDLLGLPEELARALPSAYLVESAEHAERLARTHPDVAFASRQGLWAQGGLLHLEGEREVPGLLERRQEINDLETKLPGLEKAVADLEGQLETAVTARTRRAEEIHRQDATLAAKQRELAVAQARQEDTAARGRRLEKEGAGFQKEVAALEREQKRRVEARGVAESTVRSLEATHQGLETQFELAQKLLEEARQEREQLRAEGAARQGRLDLLDERLRALQHERLRLEREVAGASEFQEQWSVEAAALAQRRVDLEHTLAQAEDELSSALSGRDGSQEAILAAQQTLDEARAGARVLEQQVEEGRRTREQARDQVEALRIELTSLQGEEQHLRETYREQLGRELPTAVPPPEVELGQLEERLVETRAALERLGPVNELAGQEYDEHEERHGYLLEQRADVAESVASLKRTIQEINQTSSERFRATFAEVNTKFGEVFESLFSGGEAEMRLLDEDDVLESGIEIVARPPGKRLQNLLLLSGGEKALTAIALLMALFHTKASPFCIFDEVDAPLDDPNTARFVDIIRRMSAETQFIVITHNKLTMQAASTLYGVTMQERGVSKTVSVSLDEVQPDQQLASVS